MFLNLITYPAFKLLAFLFKKMNYTIQMVKQKDIL